jgi:hypothetical protein
VHGGGGVVSTASWILSSCRVSCVPVARDLVRGLYRPPILQGNEMATIDALLRGAFWLPNRRQVSAAAKAAKWRSVRSDQPARRDTATDTSRVRVTGFVADRMVECGLTRSVCDHAASISVRVSTRRLVRCQPSLSKLQAPLT